LLRVAKWQRAEQNRVDHAEDGDIGANAQRENQHRYDGEAAVAAKSSEGEADVSKGIIPVVGESAAAVHLLSYALAHVQDGEKISKLAFGFVAGRFGRPTPGDEIVNLGFEVKAQLVYRVSRRI
jgi:hypothetical protein